MKIVKILGGLGNQMFQYALYLSLKRVFPNEEIKVDLSCFNGYSKHNAYELSNVFGINPPIASNSELMRIAYPYLSYRGWQIGNRILPKRKTMCIEKRNGEFDGSVLQHNGSMYYDGYWQDERYFSSIREEITEVFQPLFVDDRNKEACQFLSERNSVAIHIRRGDYINNPVYKDICTPEYYINALKKLEKLTEIDTTCIISNDIEWCKGNLNAMLAGRHVVYADWNKGENSYLDISLMSHCSHNIIANSSFSWWGAWLNNNPNKIVIAPKKWNNIKDSAFHHPASWLQI